MIPLLNYNLGDYYLVFIYETRRKIHYFNKFILATWFYHLFKPDLGLQNSHLVMNLF